jgi:adenosylhomocysteine nucleosidase
LALDLPQQAAALGEAPGVHRGRLLSWDRPVRLPAEKQTLSRRYGALAVDMETFAAAVACRGRGVGFLAVRVISDELGDELPRDVDYLLTQKTGAARLGAAAGAILKRPSSFKDLWKLKENALLASDRLAKFLAAMIKQL